MFPILCGSVKVEFLLWPRRSVVKNPYEVLKAKEQELAKVRKEVEALQTVASLLNDESGQSEPKVDLRKVVDMP